MNGEQIMTRILIADDEASIRTILAKAMENKGHHVMRAQNGQEALHALKTKDIDLAFVDIRMPELTGLEILARTAEFPGQPLIFIITAEDTMENAINAMKKGAYDYITKPFDLEEVSILVDRALETRKLKQEVQELKREDTNKKSPALIGKSKLIQEVFKTIGRVANQDVTVLIQGESGTGKELAAKAIHYQGQRTDYPFVAVNCSAIPANLLESELFGHKKGAYTGAGTDKIGYFEAAQKGTLFLDEIGELPVSLQSKLLRVLQEKEIQRVGETKSVPINVRIIAATNQNLQARVREGAFREDLFFRLNVVLLELPSLRNRKEDIPPLTNHFLNLFAKDLHMPPKKISEEALSYLKELDWPGNVRQLENLIKRAMVLKQGPLLELRDFQMIKTGMDVVRAPQNIDQISMEQFVGESLDVYLSRFSRSELRDLYRKWLPVIERPLIRLALKKTRGNQIKAAEILGINRNTLRKKISELKIERRGLVKK